jgi:hypothetical protein
LDEEVVVIIYISIKLRIWGPSVSEEADGNELKCRLRGCGGWTGWEVLGTKVLP